MGKTPQEIANLPLNSPEKWQWLTNASAKDIQTFIHTVSKSDYASRDYQLARTALEIRIAYDHAQMSERLEKAVIALTGIAEEQRRLAAKLDRQTTTLIRLTWALAALTAALFVHELFR